MTKEKRFKTWYNAEPCKGQIFTEESVTIPGQAYQVRDILTRYQSGQSLGISQKTMRYNEGETTFDDVDPTARPDYDLADISEFNEVLKTKKSIREAMKKEQIKKQKENAKQETESKRSEERSDGTTTSDDSKKNSLSANDAQR